MRRKIFLEVSQHECNSHSMSSDIDLEIEVVEQLLRTAQALRMIKKRPELAPPASAREKGFIKELDGLHAEKARLETPELELAGHKHEQAA